MKIWMDGKLVDSAEATVSVFDHGLLYGDGVFEGIRIYSGRIFRVGQHVKRLYDSARAIRLEIPYSQQEMIDAMQETLKANEKHDSYIRLVVTRGKGTLGINPFLCPKPCVFIIVDDIQLYPKEMYENGMSIITAATQRNNPNALSPRIKSLNYLNNIMAKIEAIDAGSPEAIMLNTDGKVAEATGDNVFIVRSGQLLTPCVASGILEGVTRQAVIEIAKACDIEVIECELTRYDLYTADECFLTGSAAEIIAVTKIDGRYIGTGSVGPVTRKLTDEYHKLIHSEI